MKKKPTTIKMVVLSAGLFLSSTVYAAGPATTDNTNTDPTITQQTTEKSLEDKLKNSKNTIESTDHNQTPPTTNTTTTTN